MTSTRPERSPPRMSQGPQPTGAVGYFAIGDDRVRHLIDARQAYPAMLSALGQAEREVLLEMYWVGNDAAGLRFRDALVQCARRGVAVRVIYDAVGSLGLWPSWWNELRAAGGRVLVYSPVAPWRKRFRWAGLFFRDHRKLLVIDDRVGFVGGINLARPWLDASEGGLNWRDDALELRGPTVAALRTVFASTWERCDGASLPGSAATEVSAATRVWVLANRIGTRANRRIRRAYLLALRRAQRSIDVASSYFLPGPLFLRALRTACKRGVRVRVMIPQHSDIWLASLATSHIVERMISDGVEVYSFGRTMLHSKTAIVDERFVTVGSHNLDTLSWRFNLECNIVVDDPAFAKSVSTAFEHDLTDAVRLDLKTWQARSVSTRLLAPLASRLRFFL